MVQRNLQRMNRHIFELDRIGQRGRSDSGDEEYLEDEDEDLDETDEEIDDDEDFLDGNPVVEDQESFAPAAASVMGHSITTHASLGSRIGPHIQEPVTSVRVVTWNVGHRITRKAIPEAMGEALVDLDADVVLLNEFVDGAPDRDRLRSQLREAGYEYFVVSEAPPRHNQVFAASRVPIELGDITPPAMDSHATTNFLHLRVPDSEIELIGMRAPAYKTAGERRTYWQEVASIVRAAHDRALVLAGDLNMDPFKRASEYATGVEFPDIEMYSAARPEGPWSFASLHDASRNSRIDHVLHNSRIRILEPCYRYEAGGVDLAGPYSPHRGDHAALTFTAELIY